MAISVKMASGAQLALCLGPCAELIVTSLVRHRHSCMTGFIDVFQEPVETFLPPGGSRVPCPATQALEPVFTIGVKGASGVAATLNLDPLAQRIAIDRVIPRDAGVAMVFDVLQ